MKSYRNIKIYGLIITILWWLTACDHLVKVAVIQNNTSDSLYASFNLGKHLTDSIVYKRSKYLTQITIKPHSCRPISLMNVALNKLPDSSKIYLFIFDIDSLRKYQSKAGAFGISKKSLLKKVIIQLNKVKEPTDTIRINK